MTFVFATLLQKKISITALFFHSPEIKIVGVIALLAALFFMSKSLMQFFKTKNTVVLIKRASSLQTNGIFGISRNPMYVGLLFLYLGITCFIGNAWNIILSPLLILIVQEYVIKKEEEYLAREFGLYSQNNFKLSLTMR